jgi:hypothetical protein
VTTYAAPGTQLLVALYGRSLMLTGVARRLAHRSHLEVVEIDGPTAADALGPLQPDALIVDLGCVPMGAALALLHDRPELLLVGLEGDGARLLVLSGDRARAVSTPDLVALIAGRPSVEGRTSS